MVKLNFINDDFDYLHNRKNMNISSNMMKIKSFIYPLLSERLRVNLHENINLK